MQTLEQLKAENAKEEEESQQAPQPVVDEPEIEAVEAKTEEPEQVAEPEAEDTEKAETEDWMQSEDVQASQAEAKFTDSDAANIRRKWKGKIERVKEESGAEIEKLKAELALAKGTPTQLNRPKRADFDNKDDPDMAYAEALMDFKLEGHSTKAAAQAKEVDNTRRFEQKQQETSTAVDQHYERAVKLSANSNITAELYHAADMKVRQAVEHALPSGGNDVTDLLIANLGEGSEKVMYNLGVNSSRLAKFQSLLLEDKSGLRAAGYLGELKIQLNAPSKRTTNAPKPAKQVQGDEQSNDKHRALKKKYEAAHAKGDRQAAFNARSEAKKAGANMTNW